MRRLRWRACALWALALVLPLAAAAAEDDFLDPEKAFAFSARVLDARTIEARWTIADGYFMYREKVSFAADNGVTLGAPELPRGKIKFDTNFNKDVETHRDELVVRIPVATGGGAFTLTAHSQGCADRGLCYPPQAQTAQLVLVASSAAVPPAAQTDEGRIEAALKSGSLAAVMPLFLLLGLLLAFTPCVLPMVPILSSIIVGQQQQLTRGRGFALALAYSLGMALVYTAVGVAAGLAGEGLAAALQKPWVLAIFASLLVALALSMFDVYQLEMPQSIQNRATQVSSRLPGGRFAGVFVMGAVSALVVGPCVAAPLAGALVYISQTKNVVTGGIALFSMAMGMSVPLLLIGLSAGSLLPKAGAWMITVKRFFGVLLIGVAIWMVSPAIPEWAQMMAWAALLIVTAAFLRVFDPLPDGAAASLRFGKGLGALMLILGILQLVGVASGGRDVLQPLGALAARSAVAAQVATAAPKPGFRKVHSVDELDLALRTSAQPTLVEFSADWCVSCKEMERLTFSDPRVAERMSRLKLLKVDVTANSDADRELLKRFNLFGPPGILLFGAGRVDAAASRVIGYQPAEAFLEHLDRVLGS